MVCSNVEGPDFICIGMPKAGTGWLFDQLQCHSDFWMPPLKGLHYLDSEIPKMKHAQLRLERSRTGSGRRRKMEARDYAFLEEAARSGGAARDMERYIALFRFKGNLLSGDITAPYASLKEDQIRSVATHLPNVKIVLLVRDPIARVWSNISMAYREGRFDAALLSDPDAFRDHIANSEMLLERSFPTKIVDRWRRCAPDVQFRWFLFDDIVEEPDKARREIILYLGADVSKKSGELGAEHNRKGGTEKLELTPEIETILADHFADEIRRCADLFGGAARNWSARHNL